MAVKTRQELKDYADANINTNGVQGITGEKLNTLEIDEIDSFALLSELADASDGKVKYSDEDDVATFLQYKLVAGDGIILSSLAPDVTYGDRVEISAVDSGTTYLTKEDVEAKATVDPVIESARIGTALGEVYISEDGIRLLGQAVVYDDLIVNALDFDSGSWAGTYIEKNLEDNTVDFYSNGDVADSGKRAIFNIQLKHKIVEGTDSFFRMHWHWLQKDSTERTLTYQYRKAKKPTNVGDAGVAIGGWSIPETVTMNATNNFYTYSSGTIHQVTEFTAIDISDMLISDILQFRIAREDSLSGDLQTMYFDAHVAMDSEGSRWKWVK